MTGTFKRDLLDDAIAELGAALMQVAPSDDKIIVGHIRRAHDQLGKLRADGKDMLRKYGGHIIGECEKWYQASDYSGWHEEEDASCTCGWDDYNQAP